MLARPARWLVRPMPLICVVLGIEGSSREGDRRSSADPCPPWPAAYRVGAERKRLPPTAATNRGAVMPRGEAEFAKAKTSSERTAGRGAVMPGGEAETATLTRLRKLGGADGSVSPSPLSTLAYLPVAGGKRAGCGRADPRRGARRPVSRLPMARSEPGPPAGRPPSACSRDRLRLGCLLGPRSAKVDRARCRAAAERSLPTAPDSAETNVDGRALRPLLAGGRC